MEHSSPTQGAPLISAGELVALWRDGGSPAYDALRDLYPDASELPDKGKLALEAANAFCREFGSDARVFMARATGRVNLMGMHIEHRGGFINPFAVKEVFFVVEPRDDDEIRVCDANPAFRPRRFRISEELPGGKIRDWESWTREEFLKRKKHCTESDWSNYVKAAALYLQQLRTREDGSFDPPLKGMNVAIKSNIPIAAGLSSSSAIVVGTTEALVKVNGLEIDPVQFAEGCGVAEWYIGTRGGAGDHAAIKFGRKGHISRLVFFPFRVSDAPFPDGYCVILANSLVQAKKQEGARDTFNERVACYVFGLLTLRKNFPGLAPKMAYLRDVNPRTLNVSEARIYEMVRTLPERCSRAEIRAALPENRDEVERSLATHAEPSYGYAIRQVCMYGIAECIRSEMAGELLKAGDIKGFGELINIGHEGDRITKLVNGKRVANDNSLADSRLDVLIADVESGEAARVERARLWRQPGGYDCSCEELDTLVDIARSAPGVMGARLVGAGLGGSIVVLVDERHARAVIHRMAEQYYKPRDQHPAAEIVKPVAGSGILDIVAKR